MKKVGIITLTRQVTLAYSALKRIVEELGYTPVCGETIGSDGIFFTLEELSVIGHDFLVNFFKKAGFSDLDIILISAPYTVNLFHLPKVIWCLRSMNSAPIVIGGNEASNNYINLMSYRYAAFMNDAVDVSPDFIVRGSAEKVLFSLLPLIDKTTMEMKWDRTFLKNLLEIPNLVFWMPERKALFSTTFSSEPLQEKEIFTYVKYGEKSIAVTLQRACIWTKKSGGGCLFCAIASQFGKDFHCAVQSDFFIKELAEYLTENSQIQSVDVWDDTFNISEDWVVRICGYLEELNQKVGRKITYSCFLRPKGLSQTIAEKMGQTNFKVAFVGADALTEELSRRMRRGCTISELNKSIETLSKGGILPRLSVQLFSPESTIDDVGITATLALSCIKNGESTAHVHLYTFPLFGSDIYKLLAVRNNLKKIPSPLLKSEDHEGFKPYDIAYDYVSYDPDVEEIKQKTFKLLGISASFFVKTYPGDNIDGKKLKEVITKVRNWGIDEKKTHRIKSIWFMVILLIEDSGGGIDKNELLNLISKKETDQQIPENLKKVYGNFGYRYTLSRSFDDVMDNLIENRWVQKIRNQKYKLTFEGTKKLRAMVMEGEKNFLNIAAYGKVKQIELLEMLDCAIKDFDNFNS